jgi:hypothetical protein
LGGLIDENQAAAAAKILLLLHAILTSSSCSHVCCLHTSSTLVLGHYTQLHQVVLQAAAQRMTLFANDRKRINPGFMSGSMPAAAAAASNGAGPSMRRIALLKGHSDAVACLAATSDGCILASGAEVSGNSSSWWWQLLFGLLHCSAHTDTYAICSLSQTGAGALAWGLFLEDPASVHV